MPSKEETKAALNKLIEDHRLMEAMSRSVKDTSTKFKQDVQDFMTEHLNIPKDAEYTLFEAIQKALDAGN
jgi:hypothetical protein